eukprot:15463817-Alexandrium_andersonii.AAC.1
MDSGRVLPDVRAPELEPVEHYRLRSTSPEPNSTGEPRPTSVATHPRPLGKRGGLPRRRAVPRGKLF